MKGVDERRKKKSGETEKGRPNGTEKQRQVDRKRYGETQCRTE